MYALLIIIVAGLACAFLLMAGARPSRAILGTVIGAVAALGIMVVTVDRGPDARWADFQGEAYDIAQRERHAPRICAGFEDRNIFARYLGEDRWCGEWIEGKAVLAAYEASRPCRRDLAARKDELTAIPGATEVVDGKTYIVKAYADGICGGR